MRQTSRSAEIPVADYVSALQEGAKALRVGVPRAYFFDDLDPEVASAMEHALRGIETLVAHDEGGAGSMCRPIGRLQAAESYAYHAERVAKHPELYQAETLRRIRTGEQVTAAEYIESGASWSNAGETSGESLPRWMCW